MRKKGCKIILLVLLSFFLIFALTGPKGYTQTQGGPVIVNFAYASEKIRQGDIWKIYLSVTDPEGKMHRVVSIVEQGGGDTAYKASITY